MYTDLVNIDGTDIEQTLKLRIIPFTATVRLLPFGNDQPIQPYIGAGVGVYRWRYSETGTLWIQRNDVVLPATSWQAARRLGRRSSAASACRSDRSASASKSGYQSAEGEPSRRTKASPRAKIDLGGFNYLFTMNFRF